MPRSASDWWLAENDVVSCCKLLLDENLEAVKSGRGRTWGVDEGEPRTSGQTQSS
jgi:hypothetical protein